jgi:hypothetical protein
MLTASLTADSALEPDDDLIGGGLGLDDRGRQLLAARIGAGEIPSCRRIPITASLWYAAEFGIGHQPDARADIGLGWRRRGAPGPLVQVSFRFASAVFQVGVIEYPDRYRKAMLAPL